MSGDNAVEQGKPEEGFDIVKYAKGKWGFELEEGWEIAEPVLDLTEEQVGELDRQLKEGELPREFPQAEYGEYVREKCQSPRYLMECEAVARGGYSMVYRGVDRKMRRPVIVKVLHPKFAGDSNDRGILEKEAKTMTRIHHPNVVEVYDYEEHEVPGLGDGKELPMLIMEYMNPGESPTLWGKLKAAGGYLEAGEVMKILVAVAEAVDYMGGKGVIHRDLKPGNIFVTSDGVKVSDFGIASWLKQEQIGDPDVIVGSPWYMSPEVGLGDKPDLSSEVFSMGVIAYEMITGERPFEKGDNDVQSVHNIIKEPFLRISDNEGVRERLGEEGINVGELDEVFKKVLEKNPSNRYQTAREFVEALRGVLVGGD